MGRLHRQGHWTLSAWLDLGRVSGTVGGSARLQVPVDPKRDRVVLLA